MGHYHGVAETIRRVGAIGPYPPTYRKRKHMMSFYVWESLETGLWANPSEPITVLAERIETVTIDDMGDGTDWTEEWILQVNRDRLIREAEAEAEADEWAAEHAE